MIRILVVDDHSAYREALAFMLDREPDMTVVAQAGSLAAAESVVAGIDIAIVDLNLSGECGMDLTRNLRNASPGAAILVVTASADRAELGRAVEVGAAGVLHKSCSIEDVIAAVRTLNQGEYLHAPAELVDLMRTATREREDGRDARQVFARLTPRERDVLNQLSLGLSDVEIADRLVISTETVRTHMVSILRKLGVNSRLQALVFAVRHKVVTIE